MKTYQVEITEKQRQVIMQALVELGSKGDATEIFRLIHKFGLLK